MKTNQTTINPATITASGIAGYASPGLSEGEYRMRFECADNANNIGKGTEVTVKSEKKSLSLALTFNKDNFYPNENFEPRVKVTDSEGVIITDAIVKGILSYSSGTKPVSFFYSTLCDCYKAYFWLSESYMPGQYALKVNVSGTYYKSETVEKSFLLIKPSLQMGLSTDKTEYNPGDSIKIIFKVTDAEGNAITNVHVSGDIRDAATGGLISAIYPSYKDSVYVYDYYVGSESLGKSLKIYAESVWKEQRANASAVVSVTKRGLNGDVVFEKDVLTPGDTLRGKIKVFDKNGETVADAHVSIELIGPSGTSGSATTSVSASDTAAKTATVGGGTPTSGSGGGTTTIVAMFSRTLSATYKDGFYYIDDFRIDEWMAKGKYDVKIKISRKDETIEIMKTISIEKQNLNVEIIFDKPSYAPGRKIGLRVLIAYPDGSIVKDAYVSGEIFPLEQTTRQLAGWEETPSVCRMYVSTQGPIYYKGTFVHRYYIDDVFIPAWCPVGKYVVRLKVGKAGYEETEFTKEFDVTLPSVILEAGFRIESQQNSANLIIFVEAKDESGKLVTPALRGYFHPFSNITCVKQISMGYDELSRRYQTNVYLSRAECPPGDYVLELTATHPSMLEGNVTQLVRVQYNEGYEYNVYVPPSSGTGQVCKEVPCGNNCVQRICENQATVCEPSTVVDKECLSRCQSDASAFEMERQGSAEFDMSVCVDNCTTKVGCEKPSASNASDVMAKLDEIKREIAKTQQQVGTIESLLRTLLNFIMSIAQNLGITSQPLTKAPGITTTSVTVAAA
ncbi:MAG: hypothetical protein V1731_00245 [Candidatus Aenigmatarchaeota archaeon]